MMSNQGSPFISLIHLQRLKQLYSAFGQTPSYVDMNQLTGIFFCSDRNASKLMNILKNKGFIDWVPGRGRGNKSALSLPMSFEEILLKQLEYQVCSGKINEAFVYAEHFEKRTLLQKKLPLWLNETKVELSKVNTLLYIVSYSFPECRPMYARSSSSILLLEAVFDTLVRYDEDTGKIRPHLAHHYYFKDNQYHFRLRPDIYFHNGERLRPQHIKSCFDYRCITEHPYLILYRHIEKIEIKDDWVIFHLKQKEPTFLHLLTDIHSAVFYMDPTQTKVSEDQFKQAIGTGAYSLSHQEKDHWILSKFDRYFGIGGLIERAEFWSTQHQEAIQSGHVYEKCPVQPEDHENAHSVEQHACATLEFANHKNQLSIDERAWLIHKIRQFAVDHNTPINSLANSIMPYHQKRAFHLFHHTMKKPERTISVQYRKGDEWELKPLFDYLDLHGISFSHHVVERTNYPWSGSNGVDLYYSCYVFGNNLSFQYYEWLLTGNIFQTCLNAKERRSLLLFVDTIMQESSDSTDFMEKLYRGEDWLIQNCHYIPLWRDHAFYNISDKLHGKKMDNMGVMSLAQLWLE